MQTENILMRVLLSGIFGLARERVGEIVTDWIQISHRIGGLLPASALAVSIQRFGNIDAVLRAIERERREVAHDQNEEIDMSITYQFYISEMWISDVYEMFRLLKERNLLKKNEEFQKLMRQLELLRIPIDKHELAGDKKAKSPIPFEKSPKMGDQSDIYYYDPKDSKRGHFMPKAVSQNGSAMWYAVDIKQGASYWIERLGISDSIVEYLKHADPCDQA